MNNHIYINGKSSFECGQIKRLIRTVLVAAFCKQFLPFMLNAVSISGHAPFYDAIYNCVHDIILFQQLYIGALESLSLYLKFHGIFMYIF